MYLLIKLTRLYSKPVFCYIDAFKGHQLNECAKGTFLHPAKLPCTIYNRLHVGHKGCDY